MKKRLLYGALLMATMLTTSCENDKWEEGIPGVVSVTKTGFMTLETFDVGESMEQQIMAVKAGLSDAATTVHLAPDPTKIDSINNAQGTNYQLLPANCYELTESSITLPVGTKEGRTTLKYYPDRIAALSGYGTVKFILPLVATADGLTLNQERSLSIYGFKIMRPDIRMQQEAPESFTFTASGTDPEVKAVAEVLFNNQWDIHLTFAAEQKDVDTYNQANSTHYRLLPSNAYTLDPTAPVLATGINSTSVGIKVKKGELILGGNYMLPLKLSAVSKFEVYPGATTSTFFISYPGDMIDKSGWTITANTEELTGEPTGGGHATHLIDNDLNTYWHSQWDGGSHALPHILEIDMKKDIQVGRIDCARRPAQDGLKYFNLEGSIDGTNWTSMGEFNVIQVDGLQPYAVKNMTARYIRMTIPEKQGGTVAFMAELTVYGLIR